MTTELPHYRGSLLKSLSPAELGCGPGLQTEVMVVGLGCVALVALVLVISSLCCLCRNKLRLLASTCAVSARENSYKVRSVRRKLEVIHPLFRTLTTIVSTSGKFKDTSVQQRSRKVSNGVRFPTH